MSKIEYFHGLLYLKQTIPTEMLCSPPGSPCPCTSIENKKRILKAVREKNQITHKGKSIQNNSIFFNRKFKRKKAWSEVF
jgi:hypothetical protein